MLPGARRFGAAADSAAHVHAGSSIEETNAVVVDAINDRAIEGASDIFCLVREAWPVTHPAQALLQVVTRLRVNDMVCPPAPLSFAHRVHTACTQSAVSHVAPSMLQPLHSTVRLMSMRCDGGYITSIRGANYGLSLVRCQPTATPKKISRASFVYCAGQ